MSSYRISASLALAAALIGATLGSVSMAQESHSGGRPEGGHQESAHPGAPAPHAPAQPAYHGAPPAAPAYHGAPPPAAHYDGRGQVLDSRYNHGRYYAPVGTVAHTLPGEYRAYYHHGAPYYFSGGVWYAPRGPGFVVITPPIGLGIAVLPPYYSTLWVGGVPYYYADNVYYTAAPDQGGYVVASPPDDGGGQGAPPPDGGGDPNASGDAAYAQPPPQAQPPQAQPPSDFIIYPKQGQSKDQQAADQYECHNWAKGQTGFDPTQQNGGVAGGDADRAHSNYDRAMAACLQGRGYQVN
jgi:hypothetical protein